MDPERVLRTSPERFPGSSPELSADQPVGVVDIGSNSVRLVIYEAAQRNPVPLFNEKVPCAIGRNLATLQVLDPDGLRRARRTLKRFRAVADVFGIGTLHVVATAAAREATNGAAFVAEAEEVVRGPVKLLSGDEEAALAADGVLSGIPGADGLVGDLGGGSLELTRLIGGERGPTVSLPLGPLRLMDMAGKNVATARRLVSDALAEIPWLDQVRGKPLYAVGGVWRTIARLHMSQRDYPLHVLQAYTIEADDAQRVAKVIAGQSRKSLQTLKEIARHRLDTIPYGALVLERILAQAGISKVIVSSYGLREGILFGLLSPAERAQDPLIEAARELARTVGRSAAHLEELIDWTAPLFPAESANDTRLRMTACLLSDLSWRAHPDYRAEHSFNEVLTAPFSGIDHPERAFLALTLYHRHVGDAEIDRTKLVKPIVGDERAQRAREIGLALRLGHAVSGSRPGSLPLCRLALAPGTLTLDMAQPIGGLAGESVQKRLGALAAAFVREPVLLARGEPPVTTG